MTREEREDRKRDIKDRAAVILNGMLDGNAIPARHFAEQAVDAALDIEEMVEKKWDETEGKI